MDLTDMPTPSARAASAVEPMTPADVPAVLALAPKAFRVRDAAGLEQQLLHNPYFPPSAVHVLRGRDGPVGLSILVENTVYANPPEIDAAMPCYRLGAVGTEGMQTKRVNGLFGFAAAPGNDVSRIGLDLLSHAALRLQESDLATLAGQAATDAPHLLRF